MKEYLLKKGWKARTEKLDAQKVGEELEAMAERDECSPAQIVEAARKKKSPLHLAFTWDDTEAAEQFRLEQARDLARCVRVRIIDTEDHAPVLVNVITRAVPSEEDPTPAARTYRTLAAVVREVDLFASAVTDLRRQISRLEVSVSELYTAAGSDERTAKLAMLSEALATAHSIADNIN